MRRRCEPRCFDEPRRCGIITGIPTMRVSDTGMKRIHRVGPAWAMARTLWRALRAMLAAPAAVRILVCVALILAVWSAANLVYQVVRKPTELFFPVSGTLA